MNLIYGGIGAVWIGATVVVIFGIGGLALFSPVPFFSDWLKSVRLYDVVTTVGYGYAVLMSLSAIALGLYRNHDSWGKPISVKPEEIVLACLGGFILIGLLAGQLIRIVS